MDLAQVIMISIVVSFGLIYIAVKYNEKKERAIELKQGYKVEFLPEHALQIQDKVAIVYYENGKANWYSGNKVKSEYIIDLPKSSRADIEIVKKRILTEVNRKYIGYRKHLKINIV